MDGNNSKINYHVELLLLNYYASILPRPERIVWFEDRKQAWKTWKSMEDYYPQTYVS